MNPIENVSDLPEPDHVDETTIPPLEPEDDGVTSHTNETP